MRTLSTLAPILVSLAVACGPKPAPAPAEPPPANESGGDVYGGDVYGGLGYDGGDGYGGDGYGGQPVVYDPPLASAAVECDAYLRTSGALLTCEAFPPETKDALRAGMDAIEQAIASGVPPEADAAIAEGCRLGTTGLVDAARSMGCPAP